MSAAKIYFSKNFHKVGNENMHVILQHNIFYYYRRFDHSSELFISNVLMKTSDGRSKRR